MTKQDKKDFLTRDSLWAAIRRSIEEQKDSDEPNQRQISQKERVLNVLFNPLVWTKKDEDSTIESQVELFVNKDSNLYAYTFFLCSNPQFKYNWSYLLNKIEPLSKNGTYAHTLLHFSRFVDLMIGDINHYIENIQIKTSSLTFVINQFLKIKWSEKSSFVVDIELNELSNVVRTVSENSYNLMVYLESTLLCAYNRKKKDNVDNRSEILSAIEGALEKGLIK